MVTNEFALFIVAGSFSISHGGLQRGGSKSVKDVGQVVPYQNTFAATSGALTTSFCCTSWGLAISLKLCEWFTSHCAIKQSLVVPEST